ncbi:NAD(P)H-binding protein [Streptomyces sp. NPDC057638]|uniref:NAD(P)H-binding protein n=1 Tax=Streptomyces sp. NPDC057638 TaxID=3346190 RepID=UPI00368FF59D
MTNSSPAVSPASAPSSAPVLVLAATGKTGRRVAAQLRDRGVPVRAASRSSEVRFDWNDESTWGPALDGVRAVYVVDSQAADAADTTRAFAEAAAARGVERLVLLSARVWPELDPGTGELLATERAVQEAGPEWTILRPAWFAQNFTEEDWFGPFLTDGELRLPTGDGREPFIDLDDLAEVAAAALTEPGHAGQIYTLSGPQALTWGEVVGILAKELGRELRYTPVTEDQFRQDLAERGLPDGHADVFLTLYRHISASGSADLSDNGVERALGRAPKDFSVYASTVEK